MTNSAPLEILPFDPQAHGEAVVRLFRRNYHPPHWLHDEKILRWKLIDHHLPPPLKHSAWTLWEPSTGEARGYVFGLRTEVAVGGHAKLTCLWPGDWFVEPTGQGWCRRMYALQFDECRIMAAFGGVDRSHEILRRSGWTFDYESDRRFFVRWGSSTWWKDRIVRTIARVRGMPNVPEPQGVTPRKVDRLPAEVLDLANEDLARGHVFSVRHEAFTDWYFTRFPYPGDYDLFVAERNGRPAGHLVCFQSRRDGPHTGKIVDLHFRGLDPGGLRWLMAMGLRHLHAQGVLRAEFHTTSPVLQQTAREAGMTETRGWPFLLLSREERIPADLTWHTTFYDDDQAYR